MFDSALHSLASAPAPSEVDDAELVELIQAWERLASWAAAGQLAAIAELARRRPRDLLDRPGGQVDAGHRGLPEISEFAVDEVAAALRLSRPAAGLRLMTAVELTRLPATADALRDGVLDVPKVRAVVDAVSVLDDATAAAVERQVLPRAALQTVGQLRNSLARAVLAADPAAAEQRHEQAVAGREVAIRPLRDGMAELWAFLPADAAAAVYARIDRIARAAPAADPRTMDARRADALVTTVLTAGLQSPARAAAGPTTSGTGTARATADTATGLTATTASDPTDTATAATAATATPHPSHRSCRHDRSRCHWSCRHDRCRHRRHQHRHHRHRHRRQRRDRRRSLGDLAAGCHPCDRSRLHGARPRRRARRPRRPWPHSGLDGSPSRDRPALAEGDPGRGQRRCHRRRPGCVHALRRARRSRPRQGPHLPLPRLPAAGRSLRPRPRRPWPEGSTTAGNLAALCRHHHRLKHQTQWTVRAGPGGELAWTTPTGHTYRTDPATD